MTDLAASIVTLQAPLPEQAPLQPVKAEPGDAVGVSVTIVPGGKPTVQVAPQFTPPGLEVTVPLPAPERETVRSNGVRSNTAVTLRAALIVTTA